MRRLFAANDYHVIVEYAMRYGTPGIPAMLNQLKLEGAERVLLVPMYPQYSSSTTATAFDDAFTALKRVRNQPEIRTIRHYADHPAYIGALAEQVRDYWRHHGQPDFAAGDKLVLSFHGVPKRTMDLGDPYHDQCQQTGSLLTAALGLDAGRMPGDVPVAFRPRGVAAAVHRADARRTRRAAACKRVDVFCPGFTADCLETIEEIGIEVRDEFLHAGGKEFHRIPCLNASPAWIKALGEIVAQTSAGLAGAGRAAVERGRLRPEHALMNYKISTEPGARLRIDKWLWAARFFKTRSLASDAVEKGRVRIGGANVKPSKDVRVGDLVEIDIERFVWQVEVLGDLRRARPGDASRRRFTPKRRKAGEKRQAETRAAQDVSRAGGGTAGPPDQARPPHYRQIFRFGLKQLFHGGVNAAVFGVARR